MASLKSFLYGLAPILGMTGAALYERQRALLTLGVLEATPGRGPGSGVPLTTDNIAAVIISVLAAESLSDIDERVVALCDAMPEAVKNSGLREWQRKGEPTFKTELGRVLSGQPLLWNGAKHIDCIRVSRVWRGQIVKGPARMTFVRPAIKVPGPGIDYPKSKPIGLTAEIEGETLARIVDFTCGALSQLAEEGGDE